MAEDPICPVCSQPIVPGGAVAFRSEETVHLACWSAATSKASAEPVTGGATMLAGRRGPKSATILLVEDHDDSRDAFGQILASLGHWVLLAATGRDALQIVATVRPDLILCDLRMPGMDGYGFMAALRAQEKLRELTVIAVTGAAPGPATLPRLRAAGFADHLTKPLDYDAIVRALDTFLWAKPARAGVETGRLDDTAGSRHGVI
jgi:CheY-like chemotaxis protein